MQIEFREKAAKLGFRVGQGGAKNDVVLHDFFFLFWFAVWEAVATPFVEFILVL